jgi:hypothetical protein
MILMVRRRVSGVSNHECVSPSFEMPRKSAAPQDNGAVIFVMHGRHAHASTSLQPMT